MVRIKVRGYEFDDELYYWRRGLTWAKIEDDRLRVGLTDLAAKLAGKIVLVRIRPKGTEVAQGKAMATMETVKWVGALESPVSGKLIEVNEELRRRPALLSEDPYGGGWIALIKPSMLEEELKNLVTGKEAGKWYEEEVEKRAPGGDDISEIMEKGTL